MTLFDHYLEYMTQLMEGRRTPPEGITLPEGDMTEKAASLSRQLQQVGTAAFVRACARQDGVTPVSYTHLRAHEPVLALV